MIYDFYGLQVSFLNMQSVPFFFLRDGLYSPDWPQIYYVVEETRPKFLSYLCLEFTGVTVVRTDKLASLGQRV